MRAVHVLLSASAEYGGPPVMIRDLTRALARIGVMSTIVTLKSQGPRIVQFDSSIAVRMCGTTTSQKLGLPVFQSFWAILLAEIRAADVVHLHDIWHFPQLAGAVVSRVLNRPYIVSPHGALDPWCLEQHKALKSMAWATYQRRIFDSASTVHALTNVERGDIANMRVRSPIAVVPTGLDATLIDRSRNVESPNEIQTVMEKRPFILYVGRLDPKKQIDVLLDSFATVAKSNREISLVLVGPDPSNMWQKLRIQARNLGLSNRVTYLGFLEDGPKFGLLRKAELVVQPSRTEGLSVAVLEALASGTPVIVSPGCNIPEVAEANAGFVTPAEVDELSRAILRLLHDADLRTTMKSNARKLFERRFTAESMAIRMKGIYEMAVASYGETTLGRTFKTRTS